MGTNKKWCREEQSSTAVGWMDGWAYPVGSSSAMVTFSIMQSRMRRGASERIPVELYVFPSVECAGVGCVSLKG